MADQPASHELDLEDFIASATRSLTAAQQSLLQGTRVSATMMLNSAELDAKVTISTRADGSMTVRPISFRDLADGTIKPEFISSLRLNLLSSVGALGADEVAGQPASPDSPAATLPGTKVPALQGLTLDAAVARLKAGRWNHQAHAALRQEITAAGKETQGRVLRQTPDAATDADPRTTTIHFWVNLGSVPVSIIDGIGPKLEADLSKLGIQSVGELSLADGAELSRALRINEQRARDFISMANLVACLAVLGLKEQVVELLVKGAGIHSLDQLVSASPAELHKVCMDAIGSGRVKVPRQFSFSQDEVVAWIQTAKQNAPPT